MSWRPTVMTGFSAFMALWKMMEAVVHRMSSSTSAALDLHRAAIA